MNFMSFVYQDSQWFWQSYPVLFATVLGESVLFFAFVYQLPHRFADTWRRILPMTAACLCCFLIHSQYYAVVKHSICLLSVFVLYLLLSRRVTLHHSIIFSFSYIFIIEFSKLLTKDGLFAEALMELFPFLTETSVNLLLLGGYLGLTSLLVFRLRDPLSRYLEIPLATWHLMILIFPFAIYLYVRSLEFYVMTGTDPDASLLLNLQYVEILLAACAVLMVSMLAIVISSQIKISQHLQREMLFQQEQKQYLVKMEIIDRVNRKYHDLKHMIAGMSAMNAEEAQNFALELQQELKPYECIQETGNETLNILLTDKILECQREEIRLIPYIDASRLSFVNQIDLCCLFGNAIDNAIEAVKKIPVSDRDIYIKICPSGDLMLLSFQNTCPQVHKNPDGSLATTKADAGNHGYGLSNIRQLAEKYDGSAVWQISDHNFHLNILLPIPEDESRKS